MVKIISGLIILVTAFFSIKHGWGILTIKPGEENMFADWQISRSVQILIGVLTLLSGLLILFPQTLFAGSLLNALLILLILAFQLKHGNMEAALIEVPFLLFPLILIWLGHPFRK